MTDPTDPRLVLFELYLETAEKVSDRRAQANAWMLSVNSAIVALYGYLAGEKAAIGTAQKAVWLWAIPTAGAIVCFAWWALLVSYRKLNSAKFEVLRRLERELPVALFTHEREIYGTAKRRSLSQIEIIIPACFALLYLVMFGAAFMN
jgi:hypothetical protein